MERVIGSPQRQHVFRPTFLPSFRYGSFKNFLSKTFSLLYISFLTPKGCTGHGKYDILLFQQMLFRFKTKWRDRAEGFTYTYRRRAVDKAAHTGKISTRNFRSSQIFLFTVKQSKFPLHINGRVYTLGQQTLQKSPEYMFPILSNLSLMVP